MKGVKWLSLVLLSAVLSVSLPSILWVKNANAQNYYDAIRVDMSSATMYYDGGGTAYTALNTTEAVFTNNSGSDKVVTQFNICRSQNFPKNTLIIFSLYNSKYRPIDLTSTSNNYAIEDVSYGEYGYTTYTVFLDNTTNEYNCLSFSTRYNFATDQVVRLTRPNGIIMHQGATKTQIDQIILAINQIMTDQDTTNDTLEDILTAINGLNLNGITGAINAQSQQQHSDSQAEQQKLDNISNKLQEQNNKDNQDRTNMNNQQGDIDDSAEDSTEDMSNATSNITGIVSTFLGNLNNLNSNNCTLPNISAYGFNLGQLDLCTFQPPQWVRTVTSAVVSLIVLSMAVHVFKRIMRIAKGIAGSK